LLRVERGIVEQTMDEVKIEESRKSLAVAHELLERLKVWRQTTEVAADNDWIFASPLKLGRRRTSTRYFSGNFTAPGKRLGWGT
jgi:hypothetical protein